MQINDLSQSTAQLTHNDDTRVLDDLETEIVSGAGGADGTK